MNKGIRISLGCLLLSQLLLAVFCDEVEDGPILIANRTSVQLDQGPNFTNLSSIFDNIARNKGLFQTGFVGCTAAIPFVRRFIPFFEASSSFFGMENSGWGEHVDTWFYCCRKTGEDWNLILFATRSLSSPLHSCLSQCHSAFGLWPCPVVTRLLRSYEFVPLISSQKVLRQWIDMIGQFVYVFIDLWILRRLEATKRIFGDLQEKNTFIVSEF